MPTMPNRKEPQLKIYAAEACSASLAEDSETDTEANPQERHTLKKLDQQINQQSWLSVFSEANIAATQWMSG